jgi:hypothetical protein
MGILTSLDTNLFEWSLSNSHERWTPIT